MALAFAVAVGLALGLVLGGDLRRLSELRLRFVWVFYVAMGLQVAAFPFPFLPWSTSDGVGVGLWLASYALLVAAALANVRVTGVPLVALGMLSNIAAVVANRGHMPALPQALRDAGKAYAVHFNSIAMPTPQLAWLVDRWAAPRWLPLANVYSVGDVVIAVGAVVVVLAAMGVRAPMRGAVQAGESAAAELS